MAFIVTRLSGGMVKPSESTPSGTLDLSVFDKLSQVQLRTAYVFRDGHEEAAKVLSEALSKALVPYYPLAGRLKVSVQGDLQIACTGEGVWFVEATANSSLDSLHFFDNFPMQPYDELLPPPPPNGVDPLLLFQLTRFTCKGLVIGFISSHVGFDGIGHGQFLNAVGEFARGFLHPSTEPVWQREAIPRPAWLLRKLGETRPPIRTPGYQLEHAYVDVSLDQINKLKKEFLDFTGEYCSTLDVVAASIWRHRTQTIDLDKYTNVKLIIYSNARRLLDPHLPEGYYGNYIFPVIVSTSSGWLVEASNAEVVKLIKEAKAKLPSQFTRWLKGDVEKDDIYDPSDAPYSTLAISDWRRLGFDQADYGWGTAVQFFPVPVPAFQVAPVIIAGFQPKPKKGIRLMTWCVKVAHLPSFVNNMEKGTLSRL